MFHDKIFNFWMDQWADVAVKMYYWPFFLAGNMDNIKDISMCKFWRKKY